MMMGVEQSMEWVFARETEILVENLPQCHVLQHESHVTYDRARAAAVGSQQLTAFAMVRSIDERKLLLFFVNLMTLIQLRNEIPRWSWSVEHMI
jgi:hypothetical protein